MKVRKDVWGYVCTGVGLSASIEGLRLVGHQRFALAAALFVTALVAMAVGWRFLLVEETKTSEPSADASPEASHERDLTPHPPLPQRERG